jgi:hypothetical protein
MRMGGSARNGVLRLSSALLVLGAAYFIVFEFGWAFFVEFLSWLESLSDTHGLSGFFFFAISPILFIAACFTLDWIVEGFNGKGLGASMQRHKTTNSADV